MLEWVGGWVEEITDKLRQEINKARLKSGARCAGWMG